MVLVGEEVWSAGDGKTKDGKTLELVWLAVPDSNKRNWSNKPALICSWVITLLLLFIASTRGNTWQV